MAAAYRGLKTTWLHFLLWIERDQAQITQRIGCESGELIQEPGLSVQGIGSQGWRGTGGPALCQAPGVWAPPASHTLWRPRQAGGWRTMPSVLLQTPDLRYSNVRADGLRGCFRVLIRPRQLLWPLSYTLNLGPSVPLLTI